MKNIKLYISKIKKIIKNNDYHSIISKYGYKSLTKCKNKALFLLLNKAGFFKFHKTNLAKRIVGFHQIILYIYKGWKSLKLGGQCLKGRLEVHHIDHNPSHNSHHNLEYTTPVNNKAISTIINVCCNTNYTYYNSQVNFDLDKVKLFHNISFVELLFKSIQATQRFFDKNLFQQLMFNLPFKQSKLIYNLAVKYNYI